jgi:hypothetical protein
MALRDTTPDVTGLQESIHRGFTPAERLRMAMEMSEFARSLSRAGLRNRRPELTEAEVDDELLYQFYGVRRERC